MRENTIARNYAETLLALATRAKDLRGWGTLLQSIADAMGRDPKLRAFLETPRVDASTKIAILRKALADRAPAKFVRKIAILRKALADRAPAKFVRFVESVVRNRRQMLVPVIAQEYMDLVDRAENRLHVNVTVAREADEKTRTLIADRLSKTFAKTVVPHVTVDPRIIGGAIVRVGDTVMDGSVRRRLAALKQHMVGR